MEYSTLQICFSLYYISLLPLISATIFHNLIYVAVQFLLVLHNLLFKIVNFFEEHE